MNMSSNHQPITTAYSAPLAFEAEAIAHNRIFVGHNSYSIDMKNRRNPIAFMEHIDRRKFNSINPNQHI